MSNGPGTDTDPSPAISTDMKVDPARAELLVSQLQAVSERIAAVAGGRSVRLVAVSKLKPANDILALHTGPAKQLHFGENYAQELKQKSELLPRSVRWHFIGGLQSNHCKNLAKIPNIWCVSSIDTLKKAQLLDRARGEFLKAQADQASSADAKAADAESDGIINVHVQINTSGEEAKSGCAPGAEAVALCRAVEEDCPNLRLLGVMTIGAIARSQATAGGDENEDFRLLVEQRDHVRKELGIERELELSMGMSGDYEGAIGMGSSEVRVGSTIFGERGPKGKAKVVV